MEKKGNGLQRNVRLFDNLFPELADILPGGLWF